MKICLVSSMHPPHDKRVFDKEAVTLSSNGYKVLHLCPGTASDSGVFNDVEIVPYCRPSGIKGRLLQIFQLYRMANKINADVYHCNEVDSWFVGVLLKILRKKLCVFDVHEHYPSTFAESRFPKWIQPAVSSLVKLIFRLFLPFTDRLVLAKKSVSDDFPNSDSKKVLVRNFTPLSGINFTGVREVVPKGSDVTLIHLGLFGKIRGWPQTLEALKTMKQKNVRLVVIGDFNDGSRADFDSVVSAYGLNDRVVVYDWMPFEDAFKHLMQAHIGLVVFQPGILNHVYAMPHKMFDYMAAGMAVICPEFAMEVAPFVKEAKCGLLVDTANPADLAKKLDELVSSPDLIHEMGVRAQKAVQQHYNWEAEAKHLIQMYKELEELQ
ncbi:glycosyltransferase family 4 protein [Syntrophus aciditrophicus]|uniref:Glycosyltransferase n=1 Tax=Syntrophus aciditrophicus (strain SB) TaxID=56780 RepID=Q2LWM1_SYNAS|nr:glycosyltransferase family 4 protein [Syntrophus aciditrophicus]ABC78478.1 glycosyltransferase [Syntrophus aciditrophicus SB]